MYCSISDSGGRLITRKFGRPPTQSLFFANGLSATRYKNRLTPLSVSTRSSSGGSVVTRKVAAAPGGFSFLSSSSAIALVTNPIAITPSHLLGSKRPSKRRSIPSPASVVDFDAFGDRRRGAGGC